MEQSLAAIYLKRDAAFPDTDEQRSACYRLAKEKGFDVVAVYEDDGDTPDYGMRHAFVRLLDAKQDFGVTEVVCYNDGLLAHHVVDAGIYRHQLVVRGLRLHSVSGKE